ncbi:MarR family transcriptional regulator [Actinoplanes sp. NPDC051411]|uniref:MarR family winged helix-turn-helix transcriptional regulator n=1 Tax=Actinoplanes sp. NPDC051411 TaxID=3155522 RepID=UPI0034439C15
MSDPIHELGAELRTAIARIYRRFRSERAEGELGDAAVEVLAGLVKGGPSTLTQLSERGHVTTGSMSQTVNRLADGGYLTRRRDPADGRRVLLEASESGKRIGAAARAHRESWLYARLSELSEDERATLGRAAKLMQRVADH